MDCSMPGLPVPHHLLGFVQVHFHCISDVFQPSSASALNLSQHQGLFKWVSSSHQVAKVLELSFSISPFNGYSGLICFRADWFDLLSVQGTFRSLFQHHSSKASVILHSAFFPVQLLQLYMITGKTIHILDCMEINYTPIKMYRTELNTNHVNEMLKYTSQQRWHCQLFSVILNKSELQILCWG